MVSRWACAVNRGRRVVVTFVFNNCKSVTGGANVGSIVFVRRRRHLNFLGVPNTDGFVVNSGGNDWRSRKNAWCWWKELCNFARVGGCGGTE
jgi:hypothetical protein